MFPSRSPHPNKLHVTNEPLKHERKRQQVKTIPDDFFVEEDQLSRGNFLQPCLRALVRNVRDFYRREGERSGQPLVDDVGEDEAEENLDQEDAMAMGAGTSGSGSKADKARELARYVDRFVALMERRFRGLVLGRATAAAATTTTTTVPKEAGVEVGVDGREEDDEDEEDGDGPVVVPWEEVARALGEIEAEGRAGAGGGLERGEAGGRGLSTIAEEDA